MRFIKNNICTICIIAAFMLLALPADAFAGGDTIEAIARDKAANTFKAVRSIIFIVGGFGLVGVAFGAIIGKINWKWFAGLAVGLAILGAAGSIVDYATGHFEDSSKFGDTFTQSGM